MFQQRHSETAVAGGQQRIYTKLVLDTSYFQTRLSALSLARLEM